MEEIIIFVVIIVVLVIMYLLYDRNSADLTEVYSNIDSRKYLVLNLPDKQEGANALSKLRQNLITIVNYLTGRYPTDERIIRMKNNFRPDNISEGIPDGKYTSYTVNKGEKIVFCIRQRDSKNNLVDINTMTFVGIHELAHLMTKSVGKHNQEFWNNMSFILKEIMESGLNVYKYEPYHEKPKEYCGTTITDTPVKMD